ncbi:variant erythrocyte surface antigen-1 family protein [Babesia caballi]|uniref:Variant erythrocyte surface antigen-1 family protein n=1 Tax=Babesia caballi TaxID=5871 RepID=A0AAV4M1Y2_BABCB|nr:variant erythrocyte surface antigen-1 family protein [Babesia caballi]
MLPLYIPSSTPAHPSFDFPSNIMEAIDWILRVTGKNGNDKGGGTEAIEALTEQVRKLLNEVKDVGAGLGAQIDKVTEALDGSGGGSNGLIGKLAEGLQQFIGYSGTKTYSGPIITGGGILSANVAKHQVCNAVLNFVIRFLEGLCEINVESTDKQEVSEVIGTLRKCVGTGKVPKGFGELVQKIEEKVKQGFDSKIKHGGSNGVLNTVFSSLRDIVTEKFNDQKHQTHTVNSGIQNVTSYIDVVKVEEDGSSNFKNLNDSLKTLFGDVKTKVTPQLSETTHLVTSTLTNLNNVKPDSINGDINQLKNTKSANAAVFTAVRYAAKSFIAELQTKAYTSYYYDVTNQKWCDNKLIHDTHAKIFLGCLPLYYQALTYIYWGCHEKGGGWRNQTLASGALKSYFDNQGLLPTFVESSRTGAHIADSALKGFTEFGTAASSSLKDSNSPYISFTTKLREKLNGSTSGYTDRPLSGLYILCSCYFQCQQIKNADKASRTPKTIREMLYFLAALQFSPQYDAFDGYVTEYFKAVTSNQSGGNDDSELKLQVAVSGLSTPNNTLSAADLKSYLTSTFHLAPAFIGLIQGPSTSGEPWLHSLFSNSQLNHSIPSSGAGIFGALSNYTYALQFQLSFLYIQCRDTYTKACGWNQCTFGQGINKSLTDNVLTSHICAGFKCNGQSGCSHNGQGTANQCNHNNYGQDGGCGKSGSLSPLQAFLTDKLKGFSRGHPSDPSSHLATCSGYFCHVPMGFTADNLRSASNGNAQGGLNIAYALGSFCGGFNTPLRQLSEKLGCFTKRTPRTLGDLFGFVWHLNGQLFKNERPTLKTIFENFF